MAGRGTGWPLTLRCAKCKASRSHSAFECGRFVGLRLIGTRLEATGRKRELTSSQRGNGHSRALRYRAEYKCLDCGHVGWSRHRTMETLLKRREKSDVDADG